MISPFKVSYSKFFDNPNFPFQILRGSRSVPVTTEEHKTVPEAVDAHPSSTSSNSSKSYEKIIIEVKSKDPSEIIKASLQETKSLAELIEI